MIDENTIVRGKQLAIRREMIRRGISIKQVQLDGGWKNSSTVLSHFPNPDGGEEPHTLSVSTLYRLLSTGALPADLLSLLLPDGFALVRAPEGINHDELSDCMVDYLAEKQRAHHPESECGAALGPVETQSLNSKVVSLVRVA